jgi:hypothetical protein
MLDCKKKLRRPLGAPPYPFGQTTIYCPRPNPNGPIRTTKWVGPLEMPLGSLHGLI